MIHVEAKPEPPSFEEKVRHKGIGWLREHNIPLDEPLPKKIKIPPYWRHCLPDLKDSYASVCAYLAIRIESIMGGLSVDHFIAKSCNAGLAYEWSNYRLACSLMNARKRDFDDVLDPFEVKTGWFHLELITGRIYPNPSLSEATQRKVKCTINRLGLDDPSCRDLRVSNFDDYVNKNISAEYLKKHSPFVWEEAHRQGCL